MVPRRAYWPEELPEASGPHPEMDFVVVVLGGQFGLEPVIASCQINGS